MYLPMEVPAHAVSALAHVEYHHKASSGRPRGHGLTGFSWRGRPLWSVGTAKLITIFFGPQESSYRYLWTMSEPNDTQTKARRIYSTRRVLWEPAGADGMPKNILKNILRVSDLLRGPSDMYGRVRGSVP